MDWLQFFASITSSVMSLAWPATLAWGLWLFRSELGSLLPRLKLKGGDWEASFRLDQAEAEVKRLPQQAAPAALPTAEETNRYVQLAQASPRAAILDIRSNLEQQVRELAVSAQIENADHLPMALLVRELRHRDLIDTHSAALLDDLRAVGNSAAHDPSAVGITKDQAIKYKELGDAAINTILNVARHIAGI